MAAICQPVSMTTATGLVLDEFWAHDPFIVADRTTGTYLLYTAGKGEPVVHAYTSADLRHWTGPTTVFTVPGGGWANPDQGPWAPEVHEHGGRWYLFTTLHDSRTPLPDASDGGSRFRAFDADDRPVHTPQARGTVTAVADSPLGPFELLDPSRPVPPPEFMTLDGTLFVDDAGRPWMVYAHEWVQLLDGTIEAVPLSDDLSRAVGDPVHLFRGSEASFLRGLAPGTRSPVPYVTDGPQLRRLPGGALLMLWATYRRGDGQSEYVETSAISRDGSLSGPWEQQGVLVGGNAGHGMLFETFGGELMLVLHRGMGTPRVRAELHRVEESADGIRVVAERDEPA